MKKNISSYKWLLCLICLELVLGACKRQDDWLDVKRLKGDVTPQSIADYQAILDRNTSINNQFSDIGLVGTDNLYVADVDFAAAPQAERDAYLWKTTLWDGQAGVSYEWNTLYTIIEFANIDIDGLAKIDPHTLGYNNVKGQALFLRAICNLQLCQLFCKAYNPSTASTDLGIPLRLSSDVNIIYQRSTLQQSYDQIFSDIKESINLLDNIPLYTRRPGKYAAWALLAKADLITGNYAEALTAASEALKSNATLLDFNNSSLVSLTPTYRFPADDTKNPEILYFAWSASYNTVRPATTNKGYVAPDLYNLYEPNDLRKTLFYAQSGTGYKFRGDYTGTFNVFCGLAVNELYLIRAECYARQNNVNGALDDLNTLLLKRYKTGTFIPRTAPDADSALALVLQERRKELPFTGNIRWEDLKRLNQDPRFQVTVTHISNGQTYTLNPGSLHYALPVPANEVQLTGITQNSY